MTKRLSSALASDYRELGNGVRSLAGCDCAEEAAQTFTDKVYERFADSLVLLRLFITAPYAGLPQADRLFVDRRGRETNTAQLIHGATPIFTLLGTRGTKPEWNDRKNSQHFRCIPLASTAFIASLSMLSRQFESVGFDLKSIDAWETEVAAKGGADRYRGTLYIKDAGTDRDAQGRMIVPKQEFVSTNCVKTTFGFGSGYTTLPVLLTLFLFTRETVESSAAEPMAGLFEEFRAATEGLVCQGRVFMALH